MSTNKPLLLRVDAERPIALDSADHIMPWGTRRDNSVNKRFNAKLYRLFPFEKRTLKILDLGCSGGGFVRSLIDDGCFAIGLEGSDYSKVHQRAEWRTIPGYLFTCDITAPFTVRGLDHRDAKEETLLFDVITAWEVIEHIAEGDLPAVAKNCERHLATGGLWIMSVSSKEETIGGVTLHNTVRPKKWWRESFESLGWQDHPQFAHYFNTQYIRGPKQNAPGSFHLFLSHTHESAPTIPKERLLSRLSDRWLGSLPQKFIAGTI